MEQSVSGYLPVGPIRLWSCWLLCDLNIYPTLIWLVWACRWCHRDMRHIRPVYCLSHGSHVVLQSLCLWVKTYFYFHFGQYWLLKLISDPLLKWGATDLGRPFSSHCCTLVRWSWMCWIDTLVSDMKDGILSRASIILFACKSWPWTRAMFESNHKRSLVVETTVMGVIILGLSRTCLEILMSASRTVIWMVLMLSVGTVWLTVFERDDDIAIDCEFLGTTFDFFKIIHLICWLINLVPNTISTARVSVARTFHPTGKVSIVTWSFGCPKIRKRIFVPDIGGVELKFLMKRSQWLGIQYLVSAIGCASVSSRQKDDWLTCLCTPRDTRL